MCAVRIKPPEIKDNNWNSVRQAVHILAKKLGLTGSPTFTGLTISGLTASRLIASDGSKNLVSSDLNNWVTGTTNQITVTDDSDGTITLSTPQDIHTGATPTFNGINIADGGVIGLSGSPTLNFSSTYPKLTVLYEGDDDSLLIQRTDGADSSSLGFGINTATGYSYIQSHKLGSGTTQPLRFYVGGNTVSLEITTDGDVDFQDGNLTTTGVIDASAGEVLTADNDTSEPSSKSDGYIGVAKIDGTARVYFFVDGTKYYIDGTEVATAEIETGNPIGLLLALTYNIP